MYISQSQKLSEMNAIIGIICDEFGLNQFERALALGYLGRKTGQCLRAYDRIMALIKR